MQPRERVIEVISHRKPDRIPVYGWVRANLESQITKAFGSVEAFEDRYEFDYSHIFGGPSPYDQKAVEVLRDEGGGMLEPAALMEMSLTDPNTEAAYQNIREAVAHHKTQRGRFVYVQTPGIFECLNGVFGIENHLLYLALYEEDLHQVYARQAEWNRTFAGNCLDLGVDMIHVSDDWGGQNSLLFSPDTWWRLIYPYHKVTCDYVADRGGYVSLHSDGNISALMDGIVDLGYDVVHPYQESAGMDLVEYKKTYADKFVVMGGLDVQTTIGFGRYDHIARELNRVVDLFKEGGLLLCTTHFVQDHCTIEELTFAFDTIHELVRSE
ncbi:MAG: hypothetical protein HOH43_22565 [Candidatus Latescibacteria bacterium]|jgi:uroporphyrinogen decarboxylase|nr:hypothetical protein [Candidatus Latescibacterota bacterium]